MDTQPIAAERDEPVRPRTRGTRGSSGTRVYAGLATLTAFCGLTALGNGFVWDDHILIGEYALQAESTDSLDLLTQPFWQDERLGENRAGYYRPLISLGLLTEHRLFGAAAFGYHVSNLLVHALCVLMAYRFVRRRVDALPAALVLLSVVPFIVHPSRAESVAWISGRTDVWMTCFMLAATELAARGHRVGVASAAAAALLCKETAVVLPLLLLVDRWAQVSGASAQPSRARPERWAAAGVVAAFGARMLAVDLPVRLLTGWAGLPLRVLTTLGHYVVGLVWPFWPEVIMGPLDGALALHTVRADYHTLIGGVAVGLIVLTLVLALRRRAARPWFADMLWMVAPLLPVLNVLPLGLLGLAAMRFLYLPCLGLCALLARGLSSFARPAVPAFALGTWSLGLAAVLQIYTLAWSSDASLWEYEHSHNPDRLYAIERLGALHLAAGDFDGALSEYLAGAGVAARSGNRAGELRMVLQAASVLVSALPDSSSAELAALRALYTDVRRGGRVALSVNGTHYALSVPQLFAQQSGRDVEGVLVPEAKLSIRTLDFAGAQLRLEQALHIDPSHKEARLQLARTLALRGSYAQALQQVALAARRHPGDPEVEDLASRLQRGARSLAETQKPALAQAQVALLLGSAPFAVRTLDAHSELAADHAQWWELQVGAQLAMGNPEAATRWLERAQREHPEWSSVWSSARAALAQTAQKLASAPQLRHVQLLPATPGASGRLSP